MLWNLPPYRRRAHAGKAITTRVKTIAATVTEIYEGTSQIQRLVISRHVLAEAGR